MSYSKIGGKSFGNSELNVDVEIPFKHDGIKNSWQEEDGSWGSQYDIYIYNNSQYPFVDWKLEMTVPDESLIDSSWNAIYELKKGKISIVGLEPSLTKTILAHNNIKMGYVLYTDEIMQDSEFYLTGRFIRSPFRDMTFIIALFCLSVSLLFFIISLLFLRMVKKQAEIDNERIDNLLRLCASFIDARDEYTKMHSAHVGFYSKKIAEEMGLDEDFQKNIYYMGMMHDVGKVLIAKEILCKTGKLNETEWLEMKKHTSYGAEILESFSGIKGIREAALYHHERYDGKGYPSGLIGEEIPLSARIIAVADAYDAMHTNRSYRKHLSDDIILSELDKNKGKQFDPAVADAMIRFLKK